MSPIVASSPSEFQYPSGSASRYASIGSSYVSNRSGKSRVASAYVQMSVTPTSDPGSTPRAVAAPQDERDRKRDRDVHEHPLDLAYRRRTC